jgi:hypothetical protein
MRRGGRKTCRTRQYMCSDRLYACSASLCTCSAPLPGRWEHIIVPLFPSLSLPHPKGRRLQARRQTLRQLDHLFRLSPP